MNQKHVFWQALAATIIIFGLGILFGFMLENYRNSKIGMLYQQSELDLLDIKIQSEAFSLADLNCKIAIQENINFANKVYEEAKVLDDYEAASRMSNSLVIQHKEYDLLRTLFWLNAIKIKRNCNATYHNIVYLYEYDTENIQKKAKQVVLSRILGQLKEIQGNNIMLIPIAGNMNLTSTNILLKTYNITNLPTILIDEKIKLENIENVEDINRLLN